MEDRICEFRRKTCFAVCNGRNFENCSMRAENLSVAKAQHILENKELDIHLY